MLEYWDLIVAGVFIVVCHFLVFVAVVGRKRPQSLEGRHCVITGGSQGIGLWVAIGCARRGANVTIIARNVEALQKAQSQVSKACKISSQKVSYKSLDVASDFEVVSKTLQDITDESGPIFMLVNCAGLAICGRFEDISVADARKMMDVNFYGTFNATRWAVPRMKEAKEGIIVITASQSALLGIYGYSVYSATKFALRGLAETLAMENKQHGISVTLALPADTNTPGFERENESKPTETKLISESGGLFEPKDVAEKILGDALTGSFFSILGLESWVLSVLCVGMSTWHGPILTFVQAALMGPLRLVSVAIQWNFQRIIKGVQKSEKKNE